LFDKYFDRIPVVYRDYSESLLEPSDTLDGIVFADAVHLLDAGNEMVAQKLVEDLGL
jgi:hypothetical protein